MSRGDLLLVALPVVVLVGLLAVAVVVVRHRRDADRAAARRAARLVEPDLVSPPRDPTPPARPWWGNPWLWIGVSAAFVVLGLFVWPGLFGGAFLFIPFVWVARPKPDRMDPRTNGHAKRDSVGP
jgi:hypothetical protein